MRSPSTASAPHSCAARSKAERQGFDAMAITHFQDAALAEVKSATQIPVLGLGETTLFHACTLGRKLGLVTINPSFIPWHEDQVIRYGLQQRVVGVRAVKPRSGLHRCVRRARKPSRNCAALGTRVPQLLDAGADVIVPAGGLPMMLFSGELRGRAGA
jgi:Asp/Glu/hydantoin racemase